MPSLTIKFEAGIENTTRTAPIFAFLVKYHGELFERICFILNKA